ncbi:hypothetical protein CIRMBP1229_02165 [Enterococcus cecorum]|uniref:hypothetical protein n=1 Tax=Enterococcus cecorum TaxID=44008 RepID=UPI0022D13B45|nr:hypothetical protein [Enterococcus cecorum]CAI3317462.1 hypothetical protein CIRMBP1228_00849 [Enterococcus cecorum]CAI3427878.1 hypothetical protein CIRMBP1216_01839 [Enterococcus cecorum]CAI3436192.1 hypothetical protein CIRMBP1221_01856 [Enterococcus cecorum]CAI3447665.1 hypothetical protein CIRMBP1218_01925 [Enterococcus cecorum]CAI3447829.1 hypothetical protein CIRMBP1224_01944 [Enterococcus cecorum]
MNREELRKMAEESHRIWFERWIKKNRENFENKLVIAAKQGYRYTIINYPLIEVDKNLRNRLLDSKTEKYLRDEFKDFKVDIYEKDGLLGIFDRKIIIEFRF